MNVRDSEALAGMLTNAGAELTELEAEADVMIFNTCSVRDQAERKAIGKITFMKKYKKHNPDLIVGVIGCICHNTSSNRFTATSASIACVSFQP